MTHRNDFTISERNGYALPATTAEAEAKIASLSPELRAEFHRLETLNGNPSLALAAQVKRLSILAGLEMVIPADEDTED